MWTMRRDGKWVAKTPTHEGLIEYAGYGSYRWIVVAVADEDWSGTLEEAKAAAEARMTGEAQT